MRLLIVEDEVDLAHALARAVREEGFVCDVAHEGEEGLWLARELDYDLILLDLMLPGIDGLSLLRRLRAERPTPVIVLTARGSLSSKVELLDAGADDYVTKPFALEELLSRARSLLRRAARQPAPVLSIGPVELDTVGRQVHLGGEPIELTAMEYALVEFLALHRGEVISRARLYEHLYDEREETSSNVVEVFVSNVRRKLGRDFISTRRGHGYLVDA
ncbi:response regulator transcription factor [Engelhardtia mirabilis]|uniref:Transcriptional activator protein CzcR n=1 Tax=Engelhardtia mirabilis TaxID=2528011 RepID=A0A518BDG6_9BACT|nr:Transcriptional activator protein CzcR [Planctomycetes bacterium Pla133]QDU99341.1 Transcriptional activator protein CzcR [Planctomycetes bacterium Pla86]